MGREIRQVPPNWEHPTEEKFDPFRRQTVKRYKPMYDRTFVQAAADWKAEYAKWEAGERPSYHDMGDPYYATMEFWEYDSPPDRDLHRPWEDEEATWFQVWETVSEGTPVTPPFATREELVAHLVAHGDDWDEGRGWGQSAAEGFVNAGWAPSMIVERSATETKIYEPRDGAPA